MIYLAQLSSLHLQPEQQAEFDHYVGNEIWQEYPLWDKHSGESYSFSVCYKPLFYLGEKGNNKGKKSWLTDNEKNISN